MPSTPCAAWRETLLTARLENSTDAALVDHLAACDACRSVANRMRAADVALASSLDDERSAHSVDALAAVATWAQRRTARRTWRVRGHVAATGTLIVGIATVVVALLMISGIIISIVRRFGGA